MTARIFNHSVLNSYERLQNFFQDSNAVQQVLSQKDRLIVPDSGFEAIIKPSLNSNLLPSLRGKWRVCQLVTAPFRWILYIVLKGVRYLLKWLGEEKLANAIKKEARWFKAGFALPLNFLNGAVPLLQCTENRAHDQGVISQADPIPRAQIQDERVRNRILHEEQDLVTFSSERGVCRGMSWWFIYLYLKTKDQFLDPHNHMAALAEQFANGGGIDPTLLHRFHLKNGKLLNMRVGRQEGRLSGQPGAATFHHTFLEWKNDQEEMVRELNALPVGVYSVQLTFHAMAYIKINDQLGFLFDPNVGVFEVSGEEKGNLLYVFLLSQLGLMLKENIQTGRYWDLFPEMAPETLQYAREMPYQRVLEMATSLQIPRLNIQFTPFELRAP